MTDIGDLISEKLKVAYAGMDERGFLPARPCARCGEMLSGPDGPRPAETYAGTFTSLCYKCERGGAYVIPGTELPDGGRMMSHPPSSPSWRRDRTTHWGYEDCEECKGQGAKRRYGSNGQYTEYCRPCATRAMAPRAAAEIKLLRAVADALEADPLALMGIIGEHTPAQATVVAAMAEIVPGILARWDDAPAAWQPSRSVLSSAEYRVKPAQMKAKRADTLRRALVAALRAEADEKGSK